MTARLYNDSETTQALFESILDTPGGRRSVARLARTCRGFIEPGLGVLWRELDSLVPLISLFPSNLFKRTKRPGLGLAAAPAEGDWTQILRYGQFVRRLTYDEGSKVVSPSIFPILEDYRPRTYLLPNLISLVWRAETPAGLDRIKLFLCPDLQHLTLELGTRFPQLSAFFGDLAQRVRLVSLSITSPAPLPDNVPQLLEPQGCLERLALMAPGSLSSRIGAWAASLKFLHTLQLDLTGRTPAAIEEFFDDILETLTSAEIKSNIVPGPSLPSTNFATLANGEDGDFADLKRSALLLADEHEACTPRTGAFARLGSLHLIGDITNIVTFLKHVASPLQVLELSVEDPFDNTDWQDLLHLLSQYFGDSLQSLKITASGASRYTDSTRASGRGGEQPSRRLALDGLSYLPHLTRLEIDLPESCALRNNDLARVAQACPNLEVLRLCPTARYPISGGPPNVTFDGLAILTARCTRLHTVALALDATRPPDDAIFFDLSASSRSLRRLHVCHSWVRDPLQASVALSHLAPHLDGLRWFHEKNRPGYVDAHAQAWTRTAEILPTLQSVRLTERWVAMSYMPEPRETTECGMQTDTVQTRDSGVQCAQKLADFGVQCTPQTAEKAIEARPTTLSAEIDATPCSNDAGVDATPLAIDEGVDATPPHSETGIDTTDLSSYDKHVHFESDEDDEIASQEDDNEAVQAVATHAEKPHYFPLPSLPTPSNLYIPRVVSSTINVAWKVMFFGPNFITARMQDVWSLSRRATRARQTDELTNEKMPDENGNSVRSESGVAMEVMDIDFEKESVPTSPVGRSISPVCI